MDPGAAKTGTTHRLLAIVTGDPIGAEPLQQIRANGHSARDDEVGSAYVPGLSRTDFAGMVAGVFGTIAAAILAAAVTGENGSISGRAAAAILIAIAAALVNMAHVVGLTLMESVRYRGGFAKFFRYLSLIGTPLAVIVNLVLLLS